MSRSKISTSFRATAGGDGATLDRLGGEAWQRRKARMKERIREIAGELIKTAAIRATRAGQVAAAEESTYPQFVDRFPYEETDDQDGRSRVLEDLERQADGPAGVRRRRFGKPRWRCAPRSSPPWPVIRLRSSVRRPCSPASIFELRQPLPRLPDRAGRLSRLVRRPKPRHQGGHRKGHGRHRHRHHALLSKSIKFKKLGLVIVDEEQHFGVAHKERLKALKATSTSSPLLRRRSPHPANGHVGPSRTVGDPDPAGRPLAVGHTSPLGRGRHARGAAARTLSGGQSFLVCRASPTCPSSRMAGEEVPR
jgi:hypothetical protein